MEVPRNLKKNAFIVTRILAEMLNGHIKSLFINGMMYVM